MPRSLGRGLLKTRDKMKELNSYDLSRAWFDWCFENPDIIKPTHAALYFFAIEHCNRLGWKEKFGLPSQMAMDAIGIKNWRTYSAAFEDLVLWGFFVVHERSKNQYSATVIAIVNNTRANTKALSKAMQKHLQKHSQKQSRSIAVIDKPYNQETYNKETREKKFDFKKSLLQLGIEEKIVNDWLIVRKQKKAANTETAFNSIRHQIEISGISAQECIKIATEKSWQGFKAEWILNQNNPINGSKSSANRGTHPASNSNDESIFCGRG